jgi:two-component system, NarL family, sensor histidine kinase EvgS
LFVHATLGAILDIADNQAVVANMNMDKQGVPVQIRTLRYMLCVLLTLACALTQNANAANTLAFSLGPPFLKQPPLQLDSQDRQWLDERKVLRVGIAIAGYEPIDITTDRNRYQGLGADYLSLISAKLDLPVQITGFASPEEMVEALLAGRVDVLTSTNSYERAIDGLAFSREYLPDRTVVVGRGSDFSLTTELVGRRLILQDGYVDVKTVERAYPASTVILAPTLYSAMEALEQGEADAMIVNEVIARSYIALRSYLGLQIRFDSLLPVSGFSFALRKDDPKLLELLDRALAGIDESASREILGRWTSGLGADVQRQRIRLSPDEQTWIRRHPQVRVASTVQRPYTYKDDAGQWTGLNVDVLGRIANMTGLTFVHEEMPTTQAAIDALRNGTADMSTTLAESTERRAFLDFSYAYGGNTWVFVIRDDQTSPVKLEELSGRVLAMPMGHALLPLINTEHPQIRLRLVPTYQDARALVERGEAAATIQNEAGAAMTVPGRLRIGRSVEGKWSPDRLAVVKGQPELLSILNKALDEFPVAEMRAIRMKWLAAVAAQPSLLARIPGWLYGALAVALLLGLVSLVWSARLRVHIHQRMHAEAQLSDQLAFQRALFDGIPNPVYARDLTGRLICCNRSYETSLGLSFEQMNGRRLIDIELIPKAMAIEIHGEYMRLLQHEEPVFADRSLIISGRQMDVLQWIVPFYSATGQLQGLLGGWVDVTEHRRLERELTRRERPESVDP